MLNNFFCLVQSPIKFLLLSWYALLGMLVFNVQISERVFEFLTHKMSTAVGNISADFCRNSRSLDGVLGGP